MSKLSNFGADRPIARREFDRFGRAPFADAIARLFVNWTGRDGIVVGVYGAWGDGKTSVLNLVRESVGHDDKVHYVPFSPWLVRSAEQLLPALMSTMADAVGASLLSPHRRLSRALSTYADVVAPLDSRIRAASGALKAASTITIERQRQRVGEVLAEKGERLLIAVDDVDRLDVEEILSVLKVTKLTADFPYVSYLLAFDDVVVADAIARAYPGEPEHGRNFIDKIVQYPMRVPPPEPGTLEAFAIDLIRTALADSGVNLSPEADAEFGVRYALHIGQLLDTPRACIRYANAVRFAAELLRGELNVVDLLTLEALRAAAPSLHRLLPEYGQILLGTFLMSPTRNQISADADDLLKKAGVNPSDSRGRHVLSLLRQLFPYFGDALDRRSPERWDHGRYEVSQAVAGPRYFERYLMYHVPASEVPDVEILDLVRRATQGEDPLEVMRGYVDTGRGESLVAALRRRAGDIPPTAAGPLAVGLARIGAGLSRPDISFDFRTPFIQSAIAIRQLLTQIEDPTLRAHLAHQCVAVAGHLGYTAHLVTWVAGGEASELILDARAQKRVAEEFVQQVVNESVLGEAIYSRHARDATLIFALWAEYGEPAATDKYLRTTMSDHPEKALTFIANYAPYSYSSGVRTLSDISQEQYAAISKVIDPAYLATTIESALGALPELDEFPRVLGPATPRDLGLQFVFLHRGMHPAGGIQTGIQNDGDGRS